MLGKRAGRPRKLSPTTRIAAARAAVTAGQHADAFGVSRATLYRHLPPGETS